MAVQRPYMVPEFELGSATHKASTLSPVLYVRPLVVFHNRPEKEPYIVKLPLIFACLEILPFLVLINRILLGGIFLVASTFSIHVDLVTSF